MYEGYKERIDENIAFQAEELQTSAQTEYGEYISLPLQAGLNTLTAKSKRVRGVLSIVGYEMLGGEDSQVANMAGVSMEMIQTDLVLIDDIQDFSKSRRGTGPAHVFVKKEIDKVRNTKNEELAQHVTINGALQLGHFALLMLGKIPNVEPERKLRASNAINDALFRTGFGQTGDMLAPAIDKISDADVARASGDKTKYYTFKAPLEVGMYLAGAEPVSVKAIEPYANNMGEIYQIKNDLEVINPDSKDGSGADDIKEGKRTLIIGHALSSDSKLSEPTKKYLFQQYGNPDISEKEVTIVQDLLADSGASELANRVINYKKKVALESLKNKELKKFARKQKQFLGKLGEIIAS